MKKSDIRIGKHYTAKVSNRMATVRIDADNPNGGWDATNLTTGKKVRIRSAQRLRHETRPPGKSAAGTKAVKENARLADEHKKAGDGSDVTSSRVEACLAELRRGGMSPSTSNHYLRALRNFMRWMIRNRRVRQDPLAGMRLLKITTADKRRRRRNLPDDEMGALVAAARRSPEPFMGLSGPDRAMLYVVAANTGLRASELASLTPKSLSLDGPRATVRCLAAYTKNGEEAVLPLRSEVAAMVREWLADKPASQRLWAGEWASQRHGAEMIRIDLTAADVDYEDDSGRVADFHPDVHRDATHSSSRFALQATQDKPISPAPAYIPATRRPWPATARST